MRERYEDYMTRRIREEEEARNRKHEAEYEERKWKEFEEYTNMMHNQAEPDMVNHPPHYNKGIETTTYINSWDMSFSQGNVVKYVTRYNLKHDTKEKQLEDLKKARWYLEDVIKKVENS